MEVSTTAKVLILIVAFGMIAASFIMGWRAKKKVRSSQDYFGSTKMFGPFASGMSTMAGIVSAFALVGVNGLVYANGTSMGLWMFTAVSGPFAMLMMSKKVRAMAEVGPIATLGDLTDLRYDNSRIIKGFMSLILLLGCLAYLSSQIKAGAELFSNLLGWSPLVSGFVIFGILAVYMAFAGEVGGMMTQTFQGVIMVCAAIAMIVAFFVVTGGFGNIIDVLGTVDSVTSADGAVTKTFSPDLMNAWGTSAKAVCFAWIFIPIVGSAGQPQSLTRMYALKDPNDVPKMALWYGLTHIIVGFVSIVIGYAGIYLVATGKVEPLAVADRVIFVFADYCGIAMQLFIYTAVLAASMSSASIFLSMSASCVSRDIPAALGKHMDEKKQLSVSRVTMVVVGLAAIWFSTTQAEGVAILGTFGWGTLMTATFPTVILGLFWRRTSKRGVQCALIVALILNVMSLFGVHWPGNLPWYVNVISITLLITVVVSLIAPDKQVNKITRKIDEVINI